ncbi:hypothetical protein D3C74_452980 [compost metagenome]
MQPHLVCKKYIRDVVLKGHLEINIFLLRHLVEITIQYRRKLGKIDRVPLYGHFPGFHFGQVQNIIDHPQQFTARRMNDFGISLFFFRQAVIPVLGKQL